MWMPTHIQLTVQRAKGLLTKGKHGTNDCFVVMSLGKDKFQTSVKEKAGPSVEWREECELTIPGHGNTAEVKLQVLHRNFLGVDEFLGQTTIPLADFDVYERPRSRWYKLHSKPDKKDTKQRGELEVRVGFTVKAASASTTDLSHKGSLLSLPKMGSLGGSMASLGKKKKSLGKLAASVGHKVAKVGRKRGGSSRGSEAGSDVGSDLAGWDDTASSNADPGVISEGEEDEFGFDEDNRGRRTGTPDRSRRLPRALEEETPLSSLASSVQSGLSDAPAISERTGEASVRGDVAAVPSPLTTVQAAGDHLSRSAHTGSTRITEPGDVPTATGDGGTRSSGRYRAPTISAEATPAPHPPTGPTAGSPAKENATPAVAETEVAAEPEAPQPPKPMLRAAEKRDSDEGRNLFGDVDSSPSKPEPGYSPPRKPKSARVKVSSREDGHSSDLLEHAESKLPVLEKRDSPKQDVNNAIVPQRDVNPFENKGRIPSENKGRIPSENQEGSDIKRHTKSESNSKDLRSVKPESNPFEPASPPGDKPSKRHAPKPPELTEPPTVKTAVPKPDDGGNPFEIGSEESAPKMSRSCMSSEDSNHPLAQTGDNPFTEKEINPFEERAQNPFVDGDQNPFENEDDRSVEESPSERMPSLPSSPQNDTSSMKDSPKREKDRSKKRDKLEKMMKKTPQILRSLTSKKDEDSVRSPEKSNRQSGMTPSPSLSLLPLSDSPGSRRVVEGGNEASRPESAARSTCSLPRETLRQYDGTSREKLIELVVDLQQQMSRSKEELKRSRAQAKDLEEYVDSLLLRVMDTHPELLQSNGGPVRPGAKYVGRGG